MPSPPPCLYVRVRVCDRGVFRDAQGREGDGFFQGGGPG
jgi:hypothetical protein